MNYWLLTTEYPPFFGGGISTYCYHTATMLAQNGHAVSVFINDPAVSDIVTEKKDGVRIIRFNPFRTNSSSFLGHTTNISYEFAHIVKRFVETEGKPDIIESQEYLGVAYYLLQYKHLLYDWCADIPVVITMHSPSFLYMEYNHVPMYRYPNYWICEMERFCLQAASLIISPSQFMVDELLKRFALTNKKIEFIANPYKSKWVAEANSNHNSEIVFFGKLTAQKGAFKLLKYFKNLWENGFSRSLIIIGGQDIVYQPEDITMGDWIKKNFKKYITAGLLKMEGKISPDTIAERLSGAEVVIVPSMNDNLPYVVFEMMGLGKIILASRQGGQADVIEAGVDGFIFDHEQPETFEEQLSKIFALTPNERKTISANAIKKVSERYGTERIYIQKNIAFEKLLAQKKVPGNQFPFIRPGNNLNRNADEKSITGMISIVVPYYNMGLYINDTIVSILACDYPNKEILIIDDGSTDEASIKTLEKYKNNPFIRIISGPNKGLAHARNEGAKQARGEYLAFLDADDTVTFNFYSSAVSVLNHYKNVDFTGCWTQYFGASKNIWPGFTPEPPIILYHNTVNSSSLVFRKNSFLQAGGNDEKMIFPGLEDYECVVSIIANGGNGVVFPEVFFNYRIRPDSMIREISKSKKLVLYQHISNKHKHIYATFAAEIFNLLNANGPGISLDNPSLDHNLAEKLPFGGSFSIKLVSLIKRNRHAKAIAYKLYRWVKK